MPSAPGAASGTAAEAKVRALIERADGPCKLVEPSASGVSEYESGIPGINEVSATFYRKGPNGTSDQVVTGHWEVRDGKVKPLDPMAGEVMRKCSDDQLKPDSPFDWRSLPYFGGYSQAYLDLVTSKRWGNVEQLNKHLSSGTGSQEWEEAGGYIWRRECDPGKDGIKLSRKIYLPGRPWGGAEIRAGITTANSVLPADVRPITEAEVTLNGERILKIEKNGFANDFDEVPANLFKHGENKVVIEAEKRKTGKCNKKDPSSWVGVDFFLWATYASDLKIEVPERVKDAPFGYQLPFKVIAKGPSDIPEAVVLLSFQVHTSGASGLIRIKGAPCEPNAENYLVEPPQFAVQFVCRAREIERGDPKTLKIEVVPDLRDRTEWSASLSWSSWISGMGDLDGSNQNGGRTIEACNDLNNNGICDD